MESIPSTVVAVTNQPLPAVNYATLTPRPLLLPARATPMPIITAVTSIPVLASLMWAAVLGVVVAKPESADLYSCLGAVLASICALIEARGNGRSVGETIRVFIGSAASGVFGPGVLYSALRWKGWLSPEAVEFVVWQWWAAAGFFFALNGWALLHLINTMLQKRAQKTLNHWLPSDDDDQPQPPLPKS